MGNMLRKTAKLVGKSSLTAFKFTARATIDAGKIVRKADKLTTKPVHSALHKARNYTKQQLETVDMGKAVVVTYKITKALSKESFRYTKQFNKYYFGSKNKPSIRKDYKFKKLRYKNIKNKLTSDLKKETAEHKNFKLQQRKRLDDNKSKFKKRSKYFNLREDRIIKFSKREKKDFKKFKRATKKYLKSEKKLFKNHKKIKKYSKPKDELGTMIVQASRSIAYKKLMENAGDNEFVQAIDKIHEIKKKVAPVKKSKLHKAQTRNTKLQKRTGVGKTKFHKRQTYLQRTKATPKKKRRKKWNGNDSFGGMIFNEAKGFLVSSIKASPALVKAVGAKVITIMAPIIILALGVNLLMTGVSMIMSFGEKSTFVMGTYSSMDKDLSKAVSIYTNLAYTDNKYLLQCGSSQSWKTGLSSFGVGNSILKNYKDVPQEFNYTGTSNYDFSYWKFYSFLCAYFYRVDNYWEMNDEVEKAIRQLYDIQYEFRYQYINGSHWVHKPSYEFSNGYNPCYATVIGNAQIAWGVFDFKGGAPSELADFAEKIDNNMYRIYYSLDNLEVLNANDDKSATGWYFLNQCSTITDPNGNYRNGLYTYNTTNYSYFNDGFGIVGAWYWWFPRTRVFANYDLPAYISPTDTVLWLYSFNDRDIGGITIAQRYDELIHEFTDHIEEDPNIAIWDRVGFYNQIYEMASYYDSYTDFGLCSFYKMYDWKKECKLEYGMYSKMSFDEAIRKMFLSKENGAELYAYYLTLLGDESSSSNFNYGMHQTFHSPLGLGLVDMIKGNYIINDFGYNIKKWNVAPYEVNPHEGMDIIQNSGSKVYASLSGEVKDVKNGYLILESKQVNLWYDKEREVRIIYSNISTNLNKGDKVKAGDLIGTTTNSKKCYKENNSVISYDYLHISVEMNYKKGFNDNWIYVDPKLVIGLDATKRT